MTLKDGDEKDNPLEVSPSQSMNSNRRYNVEDTVRGAGEVEEHHTTMNAEDIREAVVGKHFAVGKAAAENRTVEVDRVVGVGKVVAKNKIDEEDKVVEVGMDVDLSAERRMVKCQHTC